MTKQVKKVFTKYDFDISCADTGIDYSEVVTVPDQVLSMREIYLKYAATGQIAGLSNGIRPHVQDDLDLGEVQEDPEEDVDILFEARRRRASAESRPASEDIPSEKDTSEEVSPKPQAREIAAGVSNDDNERSEAKE